MKTFMIFILSLFVFFTCINLDVFRPKYDQVAYTVVASDPYVHSYGKRRSETRWIMAVKNVKTGEMSTKDIDYLTYIKYKTGDTVVFNDWVGHTHLGLLVNILAGISFFTGVISFVVFLVLLFY